MRRGALFLCIALSLSLPGLGQSRRLWVLRSSGELVEYDPGTFAARQTIKLPAEAAQSAQNVSVSRTGVVLFATPVSVPLADSDIDSARRVWIWNGHAAATIDQGVSRSSAKEASNVAVTELAPMPYLSADGASLYWFANQDRRLQREEVDLSTTDTWQAWKTDLTGGGRVDLVSTKFPDCRCKTGSCEETCPTGMVWAPEEGIGNFFFLTQFIAGQTSTTYKSSVMYREDGGKWTASDLAPPLRRVLDASSDGSTIVEAVPDTGCCGWVNQSDDQTLLRSAAGTTTLFDELKTFNNPDYDVSFYTSDAKLSPDLGYVAMTVVATAQPNKTIQLAHDGQANPDESQQIRKALADLPRVEVKSIREPARNIAPMPHAAMVGWLNEKELLVVADRVLAVYNVTTGSRRKSNVRAEDAAHVFLR